MAYRDLRDFIAQLEARDELKRVRVEVDPRLEMTDLCDRVLKAGGPALLFERPTGFTMPVLGNLFGTPQRVASAMGATGDDWRSALRDIGRLLAFLKEPEPPKGLVDAWQNTRPVFMLWFTLIGIPIAWAIWVACAIWVIYRVVRGYLLFKDSRAIPGVP